MMGKSVEQSSAISAYSQMPQPYSHLILRHVSKTSWNLNRLPEISEFQTHYLNKSLLYATKILWLFTVYYNYDNRSLILK